MSFIYSSDNKRYHTWNYHLRQKFGMKVFKVSLNAGFTCPNIDGTKGTGGCIYCSSSGSGDFAGNPCEDILEQFSKVKEKMHQKWPEAKYIAYFQAHTNTYAPLPVLKEKFEAVLELPDVVGISIATRADALKDDVCDYLLDLSKRTFLIVELGLQTIHDKTGELINRCHTYKEFLDGYKKLADRGINICVHLIVGLPGEDRDMMIQSIKAVAKLKPYAVKLHLLHIIKGTKLCDMYERSEVTALSREEYVDIIADSLELLPAEIVIQRLTGDGAEETLVAPRWSLKKFCVLNEIDKEMLRRNSYQGCRSDV